MIKAVIFDLDGVILDSEPIMDLILIQFFDEMKIKFNADIIKNFRGGSSEAFWKELKKIYSLPNTVGYYVEERLDRTIKYYKQNGIKPIEGVTLLIEAFKKNKLRIALATSAAHERMQVSLNLLDLERHFEVIVSSKFVMNTKPDPEIYIYTCKSLKLNPENCLVIEDSKNGVTAAKKAGMLCVGFDQKGDQDLSKADIIVHDFKENSRNIIFEFFKLDI